ncbi:MAG: hypothetical protein QNJ41_09595 [Xenococcaceae cyanobacterium MO_188.B32]|nr:hypothetical protein [Xenococcaceae cyanobacterium MO_188.B32]
MTNNVSSIDNHLYKLAILTANLLAIISITPVGLAQTTTETDYLTAQQATKNIEIESVTHNGIDRALNPGEILTLTMKGTTGVQASFLIIGDKHRVREITAKEIAPGTYQSKIPISTKERIVEGAVVGRLQRGKQVVYSAASQAFTYSRNIARTPAIVSPSSPANNSSASFQPRSLTATNNKSLRPQFTSHSNGDAIDNNGFVIQGQTQPHAKVKITVTSKLSLIGELIELQGDTLLDRTIQANSQGIFQLEIPPINTAPSGLKYFISAVAIANSQISEPTQLTLIQP